MPSSGTQKARTGATRSSSWWRTRIHWYRSQRRYSRREIALDLAIHTVGSLGGLGACGALLHAVSVHRPPFPIACALIAYAASLLAMLWSSAAYNAFAWSSRHVNALKVADHASIVALIAGSLTPSLALTRSYRSLAAMWGLSACSTVERVVRREHEVGLPHLASFRAPAASLRPCARAPHAPATPRSQLPWAGAEAPPSPSPTTCRRGRSGSVCGRARCTAPASCPSSRGGSRATQRGGTPSCWRRPAAPLLCTLARWRGRSGGQSWRGRAGAAFSARIREFVDSYRRPCATSASPAVA